MGYKHCSAKVVSFFKPTKRKGKLVSFISSVAYMLYLDMSSDSELLNLDGVHADEECCLADTEEVRGFAAGRTDCCLPFETT